MMTMDDADDVIVPRKPEELTLEEYLEQLAAWMGEESPPSPPHSHVRDADPEEQIVGAIIIGGIAPAEER